MVSGLFQDWYRGRRVFLTGHTGFKGAWLSLWLKSLGAHVSGYSLPAPTQPGLAEIVLAEALGQETIADVRDAGKLRDAVRAAQPDIIFHLAAQPLVRRSYAEPLETLEVNVMGTANLLEAARHEAPEATVIVVTTDKCYENQGWHYGYRETDALGGHDVYSMSKAAAELVTQSWRKSFPPQDGRKGALASVRAGNVIGGGDYAEDRIIPDLVRSQIKADPLRVRRPSATRPWQHVLDCLSGYLWLGAKLAQEGCQSPLASAFNFGPAAESRRTVREVVESFFKHWPGEWKDESDPNAPHEAQVLHLAIDKAQNLLNWQPTWNFDEAVQQTAVWYQARHSDGGQEMLKFSTAQLDTYIQAARSKNAAWATTA